jgi:cytochrome P450
MSVDPFFEMLGSEDPYPRLHRLRAEDPVHRVEPLGLWLVTRHDDVRRLFHDPAHVSHDKRRWNAFVPSPEGSLMRWSEDHGLFALPPADHARIRRLVSAAFTPRAVRRMEGQIHEVVEHVAAPLRDRPGEVLDLLGGFAGIVPNAVISRLTGVPPGDDEVRFRALSQSAIASFMPFTPAEVKEQAEAGFRELSLWVRELVRKRRAHPEEDMITDLVHAEDADERLDEDDVVLLLTGIVAAGSETTALGAAAILKALLAEPGSFEPLRRDRSRIAGSIDELMRYCLGGPAGTLRYAVRDFDLRGRRISEGEMLMLSFGGANRDPEVYERPDTLDLDREVKDLLAFGHGPHYCLGANLARQEMGAMLDALLDIVPAGSRLRADLLEREDRGLFQIPLNMPVEIPSRP